jgi:hypothetical protein
VLRLHKHVRILRSIDYRGHVIASRRKCPPSGWLCIARRLLFRPSLWYGLGKTSTPCFLVRTCKFAMKFHLCSPALFLPGQCDLRNVCGFLPYYMMVGVRGSVVGWGTTLQAGRSRDRIPDEVDFFNWPNPSSRTMALGSTQPLTEVSTRNIPGGEGRPARKADNLTAICELIVYKNVGASTSHSPMGLHGPLQGYLYLTFYMMVHNRR